jgi:replicative DNA helicase
MTRKPRESKAQRNIAAAESVLGSVLITPACFSEIDLVPEDFDFDWQRLIFNCFVGMVTRKEEIDVVTVAETLEQAVPSHSVDTPEGMSWMSLLASLQRDTPTAKNVSTYAKIVKERSIAKKAVGIAHSLIETVNGDVNELDIAVRNLMGLRTSDRKYAMRLGEAIPRAIDELDERCSGKSVIGLPTGFTKLDGLLGGLAPELLYIVGARPAMGKTSLGFQVLLNNPTVSSGFISTEMPTSQLVQRASAVLSGVSAHAMRLGKVVDSDWPKITAAFEQISRMPIQINERPAPTADEVLRQARHWKYEHDIKVLVIDYIQRIKSHDRKADRHSQLQEAVVAFKEIARELKIPVVLLAQISREAEKRADKRPTMADFKDTGALEEEADVLMTLFRNEVYEPKNIDTQGIIEIHILKNRHGPPAWFRARYNGACLRIENIDADSTTRDAFE